MFKSPKVPIYLQNFTGQGDPEHKEIKLTFHLQPLSYPLALEIKPEMADRLFRTNGEANLPAQEIPKVFFNFNIPAQNVTFFPHPDDALENSGVFVPAMKIHSLYAERPYAEKEFFRLVFNGVVPMDAVTMELVRKYWHQTVHVSMTRAQDELFDEKAALLNLRCRLCEAPNPEWATIDGKLAYCRNCVHNKEDNEHVQRIRNIEDAAKVAQEMSGETSEEPESKPEDPLLAGADINKRAAARQRKRVN